MTVVVTRLPATEADNPTVWRVTAGEWRACGQLSDHIPDIADEKAMALVSAAESRSVWSSLPDLEPRQAEGVAKLRVGEQSLGMVHAAARHVGDDVVVTATIAPSAMQDGLARLAMRGLNPDIVIPFGLALDAPSEGVIHAEFDGISVLRAARFAIPDEPAFRHMLIGDAKVECIAPDQCRDMLLAASEHPLLNLREGLFAKRELKVLVTPNQRTWIVRLVSALLVATVLLGIVTLAKYRSATDAENNRALAAARKIDPSIRNIEQAETQLGRALQQKGLAPGRFAPLSASLWQAIQASPNVSVRELRFSNDGLLTVVLAAPDADMINNALLAIQQDGYRITATPRSDNSGATLVDMTMRMP
jgi:general secretion pathway protein L